MACVARLSPCVQKPNTPSPALHTPPLCPTCLHLTIDGSWPVIFVMAISAACRPGRLPGAVVATLMMVSAVAVSFLPMSAVAGALPFDMSFLAGKPMFLPDEATALTWNSNCTESCGSGTLALCLFFVPNVLFRCLWLAGLPAFLFVLGFAHRHCHVSYKRSIDNLYYFNFLICNFFFCG